MHIKTRVTHVQSLKDVDCANILVVVVDNEIFICNKNEISNASKQETANRSLIEYNLNWKLKMN